jgi:peptidoglycan hydrolase CwlO-like protein
MNKSMILTGVGSALIFVSLILIGLQVGPIVSLPFLILGALLAAGGAVLLPRAQRKFMWSLQTRVGNLETRAQKLQDQVEEVHKALGETRELAARRSQEELVLLEGQVQQHETQLREVGRLIASGRAGETLRQG